jgi:hypothetical protein
MKAKQLFKQKSALFSLCTASILCMSTAAADQEMICDPLPQILVREKGGLLAESRHRVPPDVYLHIKQLVAANKDATFTLSAIPEADEKSPKEYVYVKDVISNPVIKIVRGDSGIKDITFAGTIKVSSIVEDEVITVSGIQDTPGRKGSISNWYFRQSAGYEGYHEAHGLLKSNHLVNEGSYFICGEWEECSKCSVS